MVSTQTPGQSEGSGQREHQVCMMPPRALALLSFATLLSLATACKQAVVDPTDSSDSAEPSDSADTSDTSDSGTARQLPELGWKEITAHQNHCGVDADGRVWCPPEWGVSTVDLEVMQIPDVEGLSNLRVGDRSGCALNEDSEGVCWPAGGWLEEGLPAGQLRDLWVGHQQVACAIDATGDIHCWGPSADEDAVFMSGPYDRIFAGLQMLCAQRPDGVVECPWQGWSYQGEGTCDWVLPPAVPLASVSGIPSHRNQCGLDATGEVRCWGCDLFLLALPSGPHSAVDVGGGNNGGPEVCARTEGVWRCQRETGGPMGVAPQEVFSDAGTLSIGNLGGCAILDDSSALCWGD